MADGDDPGRDLDPDLLEAIDKAYRSSRTAVNVKFFIIWVTMIPMIILVGLVLWTSIT